MRLEVDRVEDPADRAGADRGDDAVGDGLAGQVLTGPVGDVQALGDRLQAGQFDDLGPLEGGKSGAGGPDAPAAPSSPEPHAAVQSAGPPDGGRRRTAAGAAIACDPSPRGDGQDDPGATDLEPGGAVAAGEPTKGLVILRNDRERRDVGRAWGSSRGTGFTE